MRLNADSQRLGFFLKKRLDNSKKICNDNSMTNEKIMSTDDVLAEIKARRIQDREDLVNEIAEFNPDAILLEPRSIYDSAIIGYDTDGRVVYSVNGIVGALSEDGMTADEAIEYFEFNTLGTFSGMNEPNKPIFLYE